MKFELGINSIPYQGEVVSGDIHFFKNTTDGALVAVIDGAGHGWSAAQAAKLIASNLEGIASDSISEIFKKTETICKKTRGAAMSAAHFSLINSSMTWAGIGNVEGILMRANPEIKPSKESLLLRNGILGYGSVAPRIATLPVSPGDTLILVTDGIRSDFFESVDLREPAQKISESILASHAKGNDDALALVVRLMEAE